MAKRITNEIIEQINELYCKLGVKSHVAKQLGISASTVSKYIQENYVPRAKRIEIKTEAQPQEVSLEWFAANNEFMTLLTEEEKAQLKEIQKGIFI